MGTLAVWVTSLAAGGGPDDALSRPPPSRRVPKNDESFTRGPGVVGSTTCAEGHQQGGARPPTPIAKWRVLGIYFCNVSRANFNLLRNLLRYNPKIEL